MMLLNSQWIQGLFLGAGAEEWFVVVRPCSCSANSNDSLNRRVMTLMKCGRAAPYRCGRKRLVVIIVFLYPVTYNLQKLLALLLSSWTLCNLICLAYMQWLLIFGSLSLTFSKRGGERGRHVGLCYRVLFLCLICPIPWLLYIFHCGSHSYALWLFFFSSCRFEKHDGSVFHTPVAVCISNNTS